MGGNSLAAIVHGNELHAQTQLHTLAMNWYMKELDGQVMDAIKHLFKALLCVVQPDDAVRGYLTEIWRTQILERIVAFRISTPGFRH
jgi:hypothetical protein